MFIIRHPRHRTVSRWRATRLGVRRRTEKPPTGRPRRPRPGPQARRGPPGTGDGGFPIQIGGGFLYNTYPDVSCMYPACILRVS